MVEHVGETHRKIGRPNPFSFGYILVVKHYLLLLRDFRDFVFCIRVASSFLCALVAICSRWDPETWSIHWMIVRCGLQTQWCACIR